MSKLIDLMSTIVTTNKSMFVLASILLGLYVGILSVTTPLIGSIEWLVSKGVLGSLLTQIRYSLVTPLTFAIALASVVPLEVLSSGRKGSSIIVLLPVNRSDITKASYCVVVAMAVAASLVAAFVRYVITYYLSGILVSYELGLKLLAIYLLSTVPTITYILSLGMLIYSLTPLKSGIPWVMTILYLVGIPLIYSVTSSVMRGKYVSDLIASVLTPSYGVLTYIHSFLGASVTDALPCLIASVASLITTTSLAVIIFRTYAEVSL